METVVDFDGQSMEWDKPQHGDFEWDNLWLTRINEGLDIVAITCHNCREQRASSGESDMGMVSSK